MRVLIRGKVVQVFVSRARMIQLVEIHAVEIRRRFRYGILLVEQRRLRADGVHHARLNQFARFVKEGDLIDVQAVAHALQRERTRGKARFHALPAEHVVIELLILLLMSVVGAQQHEPIVLNIAIYPVFADGRFPPQTRW